MRGRLPEEHPAEPPVGYKIAHPVLSQDGTGAAFLGVSLGGTRPYGVLADAHCAYGRRHAPPARRCDCGFHCLHDRAEAEALLCTAACRGALLLEVAVLGRYIRFERGIRYARQRVRAVAAGPCHCGNPATVLADAGWGRPGWLAAETVCTGCTGARRPVPLREFARRAGEGVRVENPAPTPDGAEERTVVELAAEAALMQARLDDFQRRLTDLTGPPPQTPG
ncbi:hypothetical protein AB0M28_22520 [Streptomyces sp. NPDC051940]|uniref:hypothetical protein n=1 Tax=Streptomyces sp. NPDC051940 TaxID=3155675 RepID=UPI0034346CC3